jgi:hypothetical protein
VAQIALSPEAEQALEVDAIEYLLTVVVEIEVE